MQHQRRHVNVLNKETWEAKIIQKYNELFDKIKNDTYEMYEISREISTNTYISSTNSKNEYSEEIKKKIYPFLQKVNVKIQTQYGYKFMIKELFDIIRKKQSKQINKRFVKRINELVEILRIRVSIFEYYIDNIKSGKPVGAFGYGIRDHTNKLTIIENFLKQHLHGVKLVNAIKKELYVSLIPWNDLDHLLIIEESEKISEKYFKKMFDKRTIIDEYLLENINNDIGLLSFAETKHHFDNQNTHNNPTRNNIINKILIHPTYFGGLFKMGEDNRYLFEKNDDVLLQTIFTVNMFRKGVNMRQKNESGGFNVLFLPNIRNFGINEENIDNIFIGKSREELQHNFNEIVQNIEDIGEYVENKKKLANKVEQRRNKIHLNMIEEPLKIKEETLDIMKKYQNQLELFNFKLSDILKTDSTGLYTEEVRIGKTNINNILSKYKNQLHDYVKIIKAGMISNNKDNKTKAIQMYRNSNTNMINGIYNNKKNQGPRCPYFIDSYFTDTKKDNFSDKYENNRNGYPILFPFLKKKGEMLLQNNYKSQYLLGTYPEIIEFRQMSKYFKGIGIEGLDRDSLLKNISWSFEGNMAINSCISNDNLVFPVRFILPKIQHKHTTFNQNNKTFIGDFILPFNDNRDKVIHNKQIKHSTEFFKFSVFNLNVNDFFGKKSTIVSNLNNTIVPGYFFPNPRAAYNELRHYIELYNMNAYLYTPQKNNFENDFKHKPEDIHNIFLSKLNYDEILEEYKNTINIQDLIKPINIIFIPRSGYYDIKIINKKIQFGGMTNLNYFSMFETFPKINNIKFKILLKVGEIEIINKNIYPISHFLKLLSIENNVISKITFKLFKKIKNNVYKYSHIHNNLKTPQNRLRHMKSLELNNKLNKKDCLQYWLNSLDDTILYNDFTNNYVLVNFLSYISFYKLIDKNIKSILTICKNSGIVETLAHYYENNFQNVKYKNIIQYDLITYFTTSDKNQPIYIHKYNKSIPNKIKKLYGLTPNYIDSFSHFKSENIKRNYDKKYDLQIFDTYLHYEGLFNVKDLLNQYLLFIYILLCFKCLSKNKNVIIKIPEIKTKITANLLFFLSSFFKDVVLFSPFVMNNISYSGGYQLFFKDFQISDTERESVLEKLYKINDEWFKLDPSGGKNFNIRDPKLRKEFDITREIEKHHITEYVNSVIEIKDPKINEFYKMLFDYSTEKLKIYEKTLQDIEYYYNEVCVKKNKEAAEYFRERQLFESISLANSLNLRLKPNLDQKAFADHFGKSLLEDMFSIDNAYRYQFEKHNCSNVDIDVKCCEEPLDFFKQNKIDFWQSQRVIDTRDPDKYNKIKKKVMYYKQNLSNYIFDNYNVDVNTPNPPARVATQAWCKMYEILETYKSKIFTKNKITNGNNSSFSVFHLCEAPGAFILATNHFIKTKTKIKNYDWGAQSLNSNRKNKKNNEPNGLKDGLGLMKKYPNRWHFGGDNTGDITKVENIKSYKPMCSNAELMTADCGLDWKLRHSGKYEGMLDFAMFLFILNNLKNGGNTIIKVYYPLTNMKISLIYLFYRVFKELHIYKPIQNLGSEEVYLIGIDYKKKRMTKNNLEDMYKILRKYRKQEFGNEKKTPNMSLFPILKIPQKFILQLEKVSKQIHYDFDNNIARKIYYVDNQEKISNKHYDELKEQIQIKVVRWCEKYKLKKIKDSDNL